MSAIDELGYETNIFARNLRQGGSRIIGLIVSDILNPFHATIVKSIQDEVYRQGFTLMVGSSDENSKRERTLLSQLRSHQLQGLIIIPTNDTQENLKNFDRIPVIEIDRFSGRLDSDNILLDNEKGIQLAVQHLIELGHRNICYIGGSTKAKTFKERMSGFLSSCPAQISQSVFEIPAVTSLHSQAQEIAGQVCTMLHNERPTAIIAGNNDITTGVVQAIYESGLKMPEDISLIAFDDPDWAAFFPCPLTTIRQPVYEMGQFSVRQLFKKIRGETSENSLVWRFEPELIIRKSTTTNFTKNQ